MSQPLPAAGSQPRPRLPALTLGASLPPLLVALAALACVLLGGALGRPALDVRVGDPGDRRFLARFYSVERNETDTFRWSQPLSAVFLYGFEGRPALVSLRMIAPRPAAEAEAALDVSVGDRRVGRFGVAREWRRYRLLVPTRPADETALRLLSSAYTPADDPRELGVVLGALGAAPTSEGGGVAPIRALYLASLPLLGWLLAHRLGAGRPLALALGLALALAAGLAAAYPTPAGYWLPTLGWPWWPALPLALLALGQPSPATLRRARAWLAARPALAWAGLGLALGALLAVRLGLPAPLGVGLFAAGAWAGLSAAGADGGWRARDDRRPTEAGESSPVPKRTLGYLIASIVALALLLRLYNLGGQPAGLWRDESRHALQALWIWEDPGYRPVYVVAGADLPALLFYLMAPLVGLIGPEVWVARLVSALAGALTPLALYWAAGPLVGRRPALLGAALYAWASWSLSMSRWAFPATLDHLLVLSAVGLLWRGLAGATGDRRPTAGARGAAAGWRPYIYLALAGFLGGMATYAYHTGRMAPVALALVALAYLGRSPAAWRRALPGLAAAALAGLLTMAPLLAYIGADLDGYNRRVGSVSVFDSSSLESQTPLALLLQNVERYALMWHVSGEQNGRHHLPGAPMLDPLAGLLLAVGVGVAFASRRRPGALALLLLWGVYFVPGVFSGNAPHAMRSLGTLAPACALAGLGLAALAARLARPAGRPLLWYGLPLALSLLFNLWLYFGVMRADPRVYGEFDLVETAMGRVAAAAAAGGGAGAVRVYLPPKLATTETVSFLTHGRPPEPLGAGPVPGAGPALILLPGDASPAEQAAALAALGPGGLALGSPPSYPGSDRPLILAFGRGPAAERLWAAFQAGE